ncbi:SPBc2 prophage-derived uncharacterized transglycosy lase YomI [Dietzia timorensis]|uniref:SPBc2 prophage-derived uncharacterized transglycosy lase YomI n=2 Tax=Dietzia timorensis TaxID=499555 RepID=A0A173LMV3_9ACTN|nr:SPBc2 prophage-derived uncharacterized transglycosy lase YomI [Dietzia timorensis]
MKHNPNEVTVADLAKRIGYVSDSTMAHRHSQRDNAGRRRTSVSVLAGAAIAGGAAFAASPIAAAQSAELPTSDQVQQAAGQMANDFLGDELVPVVEEYGDVAGAAGVDLGSFGDAIPGGAAHAPTVGAVTSSFGPRWGTFTNGTDFGAPIGTPLYAAKSGVVEEAGPASGYGLWIRIRTDEGELLEYGHNNENFVQKGQRVQAGDVIGTVGNRGDSTGPHLHFGVQDAGGNWTDPVPWLARNGVIV